jgi:SAM-dependent methyltransferase
MITDFHAYERALCLQGLAPLLRKRGFDATGKTVLDVGCGYGGVLTGLKEMFPLKEAVGIDLDPVMVREGAKRCPAGVRLEAGDFFGTPARGYDLILMRDVLEHIPRAEAALEKAAGMLNIGGLLFVSFAPFYSPFGGHQHNGSGFFSNVPWLQMLPERLFRSALRLNGNSYKAGKGLADDMDSVLRTRMTLSRFRRMVPAAGLRFRYYAGYLSRPDYRIKFGLPEIGFPPVPILDELACTGVEALLDKAAPRGDTSGLGQA